jgi:hypothetical protein
MTMLSLLDLIERPAILGLDRAPASAPAPASVPGARPVLTSSSASAPARPRERVRGARADRSGACTTQDLFELFERERRDRGDRDRRAPAPAPAQRVLGGDGPTLDDLLTGTWDALAAGQTAACPVCAGPMQPRYAAGPIPVGGRCGRCATELS